MLGPLNWDVFYSFSDCFYGHILNLLFGYGLRDIVRLVLDCIIVSNSPFTGDILDPLDLLIIYDGPLDWNAVHLLSRLIVNIFSLVGDVLQPAFSLYWSRAKNFLDISAASDSVSCWYSTSRS